MERKDYSGIRDQVFEVIVRQALAGAPWREICAESMKENNIDPEDVEAEVQRRKISAQPRTLEPKVLALFIIFIAILIAFVFAFSKSQH